MANTGNRGFGVPEQRGQAAGRTTGQGNVGQDSSEGGTAGGVMEKAQHAASSIASQAEHAWDSTRQGVEHAAYSISSGAEDAWDAVSHFMTRYPIATLGAGICVGFCLGRMFSNTSPSNRFANYWSSGNSPGPRYNPTNAGY